ncbi:MAG: lipid A export permease/ATP-binding protein MsbA [Betaproteobacteria bacterium RIFCSPLOWO2_12_FULL_62_58]|nr:MAG: lipid A export permease/ATP-binding protein MsbA [Betaproteobacteria bacterium RIFCSPLOWO2_12_FULL_62_58]
MTSTGLYLRLLKYVAPYRSVFGLALAGMVIVAATEPALPAILKPLLDGTFVEKDATIMRWMPLLIVALFVVRGPAEYLAHYSIAWVGQKVVMDLRNAMFKKLLELPTPYYDDHPTGNLISKLTFDVTQVTAAATSVLTVIFKDALSIVGLLAWMLWLNWKLTLLSLVIAPIIIIVVRLISVRLRRASRDAQHAMGDITQVLGEAADGHKVVKLFGGQQYEAGRFDGQANRLRRLAMKQAAAAAASVPIVQLVAAVALAVIIYLATRQSGADEITVGGFVSFITAMLMLTAPLKRITSVNEPLQRGLAAAESVFELIDQVGEPDPGTAEMTRARGEIRFETVCFTYGDPQRLALDSVDLAIAPGETVALVGASGSGKSTLANLVPRFYHPTRGRITLDGHDLETLKLASLRASIALVSQDVVLFNDTVAANIAYGAMNGTGESDIVAAAEAAHAMEFIRNMPEGLGTLVGENGVKLSGGQRQRIAIARALLKNAPVLILDEATSALDSESERHVQAALETLMQGRTTIVIAHRLSTVERADRIVVLDRGRVAEVGSHRELLERSGIYAKLYRIQFESGGLSVFPAPQL